MTAIKNGKPRREFCKSVLALSALLPAGSLISGCLIQSNRVFASAFTLSSGEHFVGWFDNNGVLRGKVALPQRAHDLHFFPDKQVLLAFSRRPGRYFHIINLHEQRVVRSIEASKAHHFYGHGILSKDGNWLFTTENKFDDAQNPNEGVIAVRNTANWKVETFLPSGGVGPHQLQSLSDPNILVIANGGIHTHPSSTRTKLNLNDMKPNLSYLDLKKGHIIDSVAPPHHQLSTRHLCVDQQDNIYVGCQFQGPDYIIKPLIYKHKMNSKLEPLKAPQATWLSFKQYTASLAVDEKRKTLGVTSPKGNITSFWDLETLSLKKVVSVRDCAGLCASESGFMISTGRGEIVQGSNVLNSNSGLRWDNHMAG
ncbi:DUF1513 domain-containing protein [Pseudoalteromonas sp. Of7M-16]|uniref:DUF1513 domain-containing protein n=1 Tax=Pseudoalteromonas sp. Of7M-16 TaxID=2917756 RepID=UPI001EF4E80C|nr:DUF1513 domain-containing protein [Pseudoalteromonas sp. Of7M-16]MCG7550793.1 DUF1513 domain-containing protein [Pseudoalteromonas sp. Of7M-16]